MSKLEAFLEAHDLYQNEGQRGVTNFETVAKALGYDNLNEFFCDNPGAIEAIYEWINTQRNTDWDEKLTVEDNESDDEDEREPLRYTFNRGDDSVGTSLIGYVATTYDDLVKLFGEPNTQMNDKVNAQWIIEIHDAADRLWHIVTIYDYKNSSIPKLQYHWHVGGLSRDSIEVLRSLLVERTFRGIVRNVGY